MDLPSLAYEVLKKTGFKEYFPYQKKAIKKMLESPEKNFLLKAPTGAGKTLMVANVIEQHLRDGERVLYAVPSRKLRKDKVRELSGMLISCRKISIAGEGKSDWDADIVVGTFEGIYRACLARKGLLSKFGLAVLNDFHTLYDKRRGCELEKLITLLKMNNIRIIALSATIEPINLLSKWMNAEPIIIPDDVRPVKVEKNVLVMDKEETLEWIAEQKDTLKPAIIFNGTKNNTESRAKKLAAMLPLLKNTDEIKEELVDRKGDALDEDEEMLAETLSRGVAWHHADLPDYAKDLVEEWFNDGFIEFLFATTTLAHGVNTPAKTVVIMDIYRYGSLIPVHEWLQMAGRAGRPGYSDVGYVFTVVGKESDAEIVEVEYHEGKIDGCESQLQDEDNLAKTLMELIYTGYKRDQPIVEFFSNTYLSAHDSMDLVLLDLDEDYFGVINDVKESMNYLYRHGYITNTSKGYTLTQVGKAVMNFLWSSNIDFRLEEIDNLRNYVKRYDEISGPLALYLLLKSVDRLSIRLSKKKKEQIEEVISKETGVSEVGDAEITAYIILKEWMNGTDIDVMASKYGDQVYSLRNRARVIAEALRLVEVISNVEGVALHKDFDTFIERVKHGVTVYELPLIRLRSFGRKIVHGIYLTMASIAATMKYVKTDEHIGVTLRRLYDELGESKFKEVVLEWRVKGLGPKRVETLVRWLRGLSPTNGGINGDLFRPSNDLSKWLR